MRGLAVTALRMSMGGGSSGGGAPQTLASKLLTLPWGAALVVAAGAVVVGAGIYYGHKGVSGEYKSHLRRTETSERLAPLCKVGLVAHGIVISLIGGFLILAGVTADPSQAGGMATAFETVRAQPFGRILLIALALGLVAFAIYCFVEAVYRIVPRARQGNTQSLADLAHKKASQMAAQTR